MDRFLFENFVFELEDETMDNSLLLFANLADDKVEKEGNHKVTFNYYPQEEKRLQIVVEGTKNGDKVGLNNFKIHHSSEDVWRCKIIFPLSEHENCYMVSREDGTGGIVIRFVNEQVLDKIEAGDIVEAQVVGMAIAIDIFENEEEYQKNVPEGKDGKKTFLADGTILPANLLINNAANLSEEERNSKDHSFDNLVDFKGTIKTVWKYPLRMYDMDLNNYYIAAIDTEFGETLKIIIPTPMFPKNLKGFGAGNIITGKMLISGDLCIDEYEKYSKKIIKNEN